jgi:endonuclease YncB( thermonuclease family)
VAGEIVIVEYDKNDRYGRVLGKVLLDGDDMNLEQIRAGLAWHYKEAPGGADRG